MSETPSAHHCCPPPLPVCQKHCSQPCHSRNARQPQYLCDPQPHSQSNCSSTNKLLEHFLKLESDVNDIKTIIANLQTVNVDTVKVDDRNPRNRNTAVDVDSLQASPTPSPPPAPDDSITSVEESIPENPLNSPSLNC